MLSFVWYFNWVTKLNIIQFVKEKKHPKHSKNDEGCNFSSTLLELDSWERRASYFSDGIPSNKKWKERKKGKVKDLI